MCFQCLVFCVGLYLYTQQTIHASQMVVEVQTNTTTRITPEAETRGLKMNTHFSVGNIFH